MPEFGASHQTASSTEIPLSRIQEMKQQGMGNNDIIKALQSQGYSSSQIFDVLTQAANAPASFSAPRPQMDVPSPPPQPMYSPPPPRQSSVYDTGGDTEEMIEAIIDEKWNDLLADINKVIAWKDSTETRIAKMEQQIVDMKEQFEKLHQAVIAKVGEYDQHILDVGAEVKAMEKVFSKVLPVFTDNVAELSRISDNMKRSAVGKK